MSTRHPQALIAGTATMLGAAPLATLFAGLTWLFYIGAAVVIIVATAMLVRTVRGPVWSQVLAMMASLLIFLTFAFPSGEEIARLVPTIETFRHFNALLVAAGGQIRDQAVPVPDLDGILLLTTAGVGLVAVVVDLVVVGIRRPALAGLPLLAIFSVPVAVLPHGVPVLTFGLAAAGFLWLLVADSVDRVRRFGRRFTGEGRDMDLWESSPLASAGRRLGVIGLVVAILVPLAIPGMTSGLIDRYGTGMFGPGGPGGSMDPGAARVDLTALLHDNLVRSDEFAMVRVRTSDPSPYYLRLGIADQPSSAGFESRPPSSGTAVTRGLQEPVPPQVAGITAHRYQADVDVVNLDMGLAPLYEEVASIANLDSSWFYDPSTQQVFSLRSSINGATYGFEFVRPTYTAQALRAAPPISPNEPSALELTKVLPFPQVSSLVSDLIDGQPSQYDRVKAIYEYFRSSEFTYSFETLPGNSGSAIVDFLENKQGFCVQYAAAMAWLVRVAGYPARVAFGFTRGNKYRQGVYTLTNLNLHAWTEVYFENIGWVPFDATPAGFVPGAVPSTWAVEPVGGNTDGAGNPLPEPGSSAGAGPDDRPFDPGEGVTPGQGENRVDPWQVGGAVAVLILLAILIAPALRRRSLRRSRRARSGELIVIGQTGGGAVPDSALVFDSAAVALARRDAHEAWVELLDTMIDYSVPVDLAETPRATALRLRRLPAIDRAAAGPASLLGRAEERARYAKYPLQAYRLDEANRVIRESLAQRASRWDRLRANLFPPSVVRRWRAAWEGWTSAIVGVGARIRHVTYALSPRRLITRGAR